jgi:hypothetical protein
MKRMLTTLPVLAALVLTGAGAAPAGKAKAPTPAELKTMLADLGLNPAAVNATTWDVSYVRDDFRVPIRVGIDSRIALLCRAAYVPRPGELPAAPLRKLLELSDRRSPDG